MKTFKKILCTLLVVVMCLTSAPLQGFVGMEWPSLPEINFGEFELPKIDFSEWFNSKASAKEIIDSGNCGVSGDNVTWTLYGNGEIVISGDGAMWDYRDGGIAGTYIEAAPWNAYDGMITQITINEGITSIGNCTFSNCINVTQIDIPESVVRIGEQAFYDCKGLIQINIPDNIVEIEAYTFYGCSSLKSIQLNNVVTIGSNAFYKCTGLNDVKLSEKISSIGNYAFTYTEYYDNADNWVDDILYIDNCLITSKENISGSIVIKEGTTLIADKAFYGYYGDSQISEIVFPDGLLYIGDESFMSCDIETLTLPDSVISLGYKAFSNCKKLSEIHLSDALKYIEAECFMLTNIKNIVIPDSVIAIESGAFKYCYNLSNIDISDNEIKISANSFSGTAYSNDNTNRENGGLYVSNHFLGDFSEDYKEDIYDYNVNFVVKEGTVTIADGAFSYAIAETITIPDSVINIGSGPIGSSDTKIIKIGSGVKEIGEYIFPNDGALERIIVSEQNNFFMTDDMGVLYNKNKTVLYKCPSAAIIDSYIIPDSVTKINASAFFASKVANISIPDSVAEIGEFAFYGSKLKSVTIPGTIKTIPQNAFGWCEELVSVAILEGVETIDGGAFSGTLLVDITLPKSIVTVGYSAFSDCKKLRNITIAENVKTIADAAFFNCENLESIVVSELNNTYSSDNYGVLFNKNKTELKCYPVGNKQNSYTIPDSVQIISDFAFYKGIYLNDINFGGSVKEIGDNAFSETSIKSLFLPDSLIRLGQYAFSLCDKLEYLDTGDGLTSIEGSWDWGGFQGLTNLKTVVLGKNISSCWLEDSINLEKYVVDKDNLYLSVDEYGVLYNKDKTSLVDYPAGSTLSEYEIPEGVTYIWGAFFDTQNLRKIIIPSTVKSIGGFRNCVNLETVNIKFGPTEITSYAFEECPKLVNINIPGSVTYIGEEAFMNCSSLNKITIPGSVNSFGNGTFLNCTSLEQVVIGDGVGSIGGSAFENCTSLTNVKIGVGVAYIWSDAFRSCYSLTSINIPNTVTYIGDDAFNYCYNLESVVIPNSVTEIDYDPFYESTMIIANKNSYAIQWAKEENHIFAYLNPSAPEENIITEVIDDYLSFSIDKLARTLTVTTTGYHYLPDYSNDVAPWQKYNPYVFNLKINEGCKSVGDRNFNGMKHLRYVDLPDSLIAIDDEAFYYCSNLRKLEIPDKVTNIGKSAFAGCQRLENISFGNMVINIKEKAFNYCPKLEYITIDKNVATIETGAFEYCNALKNVYYKGTEKQWNKIIIDENNTGIDNATIHYLGDSILTAYSLDIRSNGAYSDSIAIGEEIEFWVSLYNHGEAKDCERAYAISFDNPGVFDVVKTEKTKESFDITLKAIGTGTTNMTVSDDVTGAYVTMRLQANIPLEVLTIEEVKSLAEKRDGIETHFYDYNGLYVNNYRYSENSDGSYDVRMNVYNKKAHIGAVVVYDENGNICGFKLIEQMHKLPTSLWNGMFDFFDWAEYSASWVAGEDVYTDTAWTQETPVFIDVPKNGYFKITNNYENEIVFMANAIDLTIDLVFAASSLSNMESDSEAVADTVNEILLEIGTEGLKNLFSEVFKEYSEGITMSNICSIIYNISEVAKKCDIDIFEIITKNVNSDKLIADTLESVMLSIVAKPVKAVLEGAGYINTLIKIYDIICSTISSEIAIYTSPKEGTIRRSNGVWVTSETTLDPDYVLHSYIINPNNASMTNAKLTMEGLAPNCEMYDITLYKSGQAVQPNAKIKVMIPIPVSYNKSNIEVYWYKEDGTLIPMNATVEGDYAVFYTDHLSYYIIADQNNHIHNYVEASVVYPSCTEDGAITYSCYCGDTYVEVYSAEGHYYDEWFETKPATCENKGEKQRVCLNCSNLETQEISATGHNFDDESECKNCGFDRTENCDCSCHKTNFFARIIWKITNFFNKIFKIKKECSCGINHY